MKHESFSFLIMVIGISLLSFSPSLVVPCKAGPQGTIDGKVQDAGTEKPLYAANVKIAELPKLKIVLNSQGGFRTKVRPGIYRVTVTAGDSFIGQGKTITVQDRGTALVYFSLQRKELIKKGILTGKITDTYGRPITTATVKVGGGTVTTDATGSYKIELLVPDTGEAYSVNASADGFKTKQATVPLKPGQLEAKDFTLVPEMLKLKFFIAFRPGTAEIHNYGNIDTVAKFLKDNPEIKVEIEGHTEIRGSVKMNYRISQKRADAVREALISRGGIDPTRITAKGYGRDNKIRIGCGPGRSIELRVL